MPKHLMLLFTEPLTGQESEFNEWYNETHLDEIIRLEAFSAAQRFRVVQPTSGAGPRYLALYEIDSEDIDTAVEALAADAPNRAADIGLDRTQVRAMYFTAITARVTHPTS